MKKMLVLLAAAALALSLTACKPEDPNDDPLVCDSGYTLVDGACVEDTDPDPDPDPIDTDGAEVTVNFAMGNAARTLTYNKTDPLTLSDGTVVSAGDLKPVWSFIAEELGFDIVDVTVQDQKTSEMMDIEAATGFTDAVIYGGSGGAEEIMNYGTSGYFVNLKDEMEAGNLPNISAYMAANPAVESSITAYDGGIYHMPYIAEVGNFARVFNLRAPWVVELLDGTPTYDTTTSITTEYDGYWTAANGGLRTGTNGGTVTPKTGTSIAKATNQNVITLQNTAAGTDGLNGSEACTTLKTYIAANYSYTNPSELFVGDSAAYDIDELAALLRCVKTNPTLLTDGEADSVVPYFVRQSKYREDLLRLANYFGGAQVYGSDSYGAYLVFDADGNVQLSYAEEGFYDTLVFLNQWYNEGLIHSEFYDETNTANFRTNLFGHDDADVPTFGFMTMDWTGSTTADSLNTAGDVVGVLPPVGEINGVWQYFVENSRVIKPDGWGISAAATEVEKAAALKLFDYIFSDEGRVVQNYGLLMDVTLGEYTGPDGIDYPKYNDWVINTANTVTNGNISTFLRDWMGSHIPIGYPKEIGFEYQYTSQNGFDSWELYSNSTVTIMTYGGDGPAGDNPNFYSLTPPVFSLTELQQETIADNVALNDDFYEVIFSIIRAGEGDATLSTPADYAAYLALFEAAGLTTYELVYNQAYDAMTAE